jgi:hypothetical protein
MNRNKKISTEYNIWKAVVSSYVYKIIRTPVDNINIDLFKLYLNNYHPYTSSIIAVLRSDEYKQGKIYCSFIIPYENEIVIVESINKDN